MRLVPLIAALALLVPAPLAAQQKQPQAPKVAPAKPYKPLAVKLPTPLADPSFDAFRKELAGVAGKKDRAGLAKLVVAQGFFWEGEKGDQADKKKSGVDNLATILGLAKKETVGWEVLAAHAGDPTAMPFPPKQGTVCAPADPQFDEKALEELAKSTQTEPGEWGYPVTDGVEVRSANRHNAPVSEKLGLHFIRILPDDGPGAPPAGPDQVPLMKVVTPSGKTGFVSADAIAPLGNDQLCYVKDGNSWKIAGFIGTGDQ